jgi:methyl-accepting chemotaxis protein
MKLFELSIGKKIFVIGFVSVISISCMILTSLFFFGKLEDAGKINVTIWKYEVRVKQAVIDFERYVSTGEKDYYDSFIKDLNKIQVTDSAIIKLYESFKAGDSREEAVEKLEATTNDVETLKKASILIQTLMGTEIVKRLYQSSITTNKITDAWMDAVMKYPQLENEEAKKEIFIQVNGIVGNLIDSLKNGHSVMDDISDYFVNKIRNIFIIIGFMSLILIIALVFLIARSITNPLKLTVDYVKAVSGGDFKNTLEISNHDELGIMVESVNAMSSSLKSMIMEIKTGIEGLNSSASELTGLSDELSETAVKNTDKADSVSSAAEEMSTNMNTASRNTEASSQNANSVVAAVEEMTATINEIAGNTELAKTITDKAVNRSKSATEQMGKLGAIAETISKVTETISNISEQTNLLSLNATIEAARAGEAGKGFAVVANEIKELAKLTAVSTQDIKKQIEEIQSTTKISVEGIDQIHSIVTEVNQIVASVAAAIEEQSIVTQEISQNITIVSEGVMTVNENVSKSAAVAGDITESITQVHKSTDEMRDNSIQVGKSAIGLSDLAKTLNKMMDRFKI